MIKVNTKEKNYNSLFFYWLIISLVLIFLIIIIGGLTRLTNSGLSIIEWELFSGILPPFDAEIWNLYFEKYKTIPQYQLINYDMKLEEFKVIFYWEYFHRLIARTIGLFFLIPLCFFYFTKKIKTNYLNTCYIIFGLILFQGIIGWYMVKSGLINNVKVSHFRLSAHLITAIIIISMIFWLLKNFYTNKEKKFFIFSKEKLPYQILILIIFFQIVIGAFVSGLGAGMIYQTWPLMGSSFFPNDILYENFIEFFDFNNHSLVQFYHRSVAYLIILYSVYLILKIYIQKIKILYKPILILFFVLLLQVILGILTLISGLNIILASAHQITSVLLVFSALNLYYLRIK